MSQLITIADIASKLGVSTRQRADQISRQKTFPDPVQVAGRYRLWDQGQVDAWLDQHRPGWRGEAQSES